MTSFTFLWKLYAREENYPLDSSFFFRSSSFFLEICQKTQISWIIWTNIVYKNYNCLQALGSIMLHMKFLTVLVEMAVQPKLLNAS